MVAKDPNYTFMADMLFEVLDSIFMYRTGLRTGLIDLAMAGRAKFSKIWCARSHRLYRELDGHDMIMREAMLPELRKLVDESMSLNMSGAVYTGEGPDFRLEEINKKVQQFMPLTPTDAAWGRVCANYDSLVEIRTNMLADKGNVQDQNRTNSHTRQCTAKEEYVFRCKIRKNEYLSHPNVQRKMLSLSGEELDENLQQILQISREKRAQYMSEMFVHDSGQGQESPSAVSYNIIPVFVTNEEKSTHQSMISKPDLIKKIEREMHEIANPTQKAAWLNAWALNFRNKVGLLRTDYIAFHNELQDFLENELHAYSPDQPSVV